MSIYKKYIILYRIIYSTVNEIKNHVSSKKLKAGLYLAF